MRVFSTEIKHAMIQVSGGMYITGMNKPLYFTKDTNGIDEKRREKRIWDT